MKACVDIGGTKTAVTLARPSRQTGARGDELLQTTRCAEPTAKTGSPDAVAVQVLRLIQASQALAREQGVSSGDAANITAIGISACGPFVLHQGMVELAAPNICGGLAGPARGLPNTWMSAQLEAPLRAHMPGVRVRVENDAIAALEAERHWGALQAFSDCAYLTWSTGIGVGLCVDGRILRGKNGNAGHAGHMFVCDDDSQALCGCGNVGDAEGLIAGNAIARRWGMEAQALFTQAKLGNASALAKVDSLCQIMGRTLYNLIITLDLQAISIGGSVFWHHQDLLLPRLHAVVAGKLPVLTDGVIICPAGLGVDVGDFAALALVND
ncbi:MAG: ROK family protein [Burkholderiaceae bacterium]|jgi:glucokinase|nr:ROK family protein [Burkholderiaceae bacterium]